MVSGELAGYGMLREQTRMWKGCEKGVKVHSGLLFVQKDRHLTVYIKLNLAC